MSIVRLGEIDKSDTKPGTRDAMHVPAVLVTSKEPMSGGRDVRFSGTNTVSSCASSKLAQGVVDPFLGEAKPGEKFWVLVKPGLVDKLVHHFDIPGVASTEMVDADELKELRDTSARFEGYDEAMESGGECATCY